MNAPELLAPAGTLKNLRYALAYGADAVYAGMPRYSLRVRNNDFASLESLAEGIRLTHAAGRRFFLAANISAHQAKLATFARDMAPVVELGPDALIMSDPGLIMQVRERWPDIPVHLSVQANTVNAASVRFWQGLGLGRVILSRELSLGEIESIRQACPDMELEVMVHGAMCIAYSGRCLLSGYFNHRDANQGACTNACRWRYRLYAADEDAGGDLIPRDDASSAGRHPLAGEPFLLEEGERPGQLMPVEEDEHGTYILNSMDLRAVEHVQHLVAIGVDALKIEGRTKSHFYAARTAQVYRRAIDDATTGRTFDPALLDALEGLANRGYTDGFLTRPRERTAQNYARGHSESDRRLFVGEIEAYDPASGLARVDVKNRFSVGDRLEIMTPAGSREVVLDAITGREGLPVEQAPGAGHRVSIPLPPGDYHMGLILRHVNTPSSP
ncbi:MULTISPECIES: tRNA 5-hydroxyuridine modification protein YegQ [Ectothiorhodospira]|nr:MULTISPECIES: tRNA 5-hydroxyuridine modification protein YegQ [Ectothiorhodospira]MCG5516743.1 tRNA 5-hydroxyuridine modification protein YegQ [Ectothiorhodospira sp. 9100]MCG5519183.1 tRNA 5-hydroxyuridine modification protein YegQ [Ectothiorhodospira sp. 9905]